MQNIIVNDDIKVLSADRYGLRVVITNEELLQDYATDDGLITGTGLKKTTQQDTSVNDLQAKSDTLGNQIAGLQSEKTVLDALIAEARLKVDEVIAKR